jgi:hypothetical protein
MRSLGIAMVALLWANSGSAQVALDSFTIQTAVSANTPSCSDPGSGGVGVPMGTASCAGPLGYTSSAGASASFVSNPMGATMSVSSFAAANVPGMVPVDDSNGNASGGVLGNWTANVDAHYSVSTTGDATTNLSGTAGGNLPASGTLAMNDVFSVSINSSVFAFARDNGSLAAADASSGEAEVTFAPVGANDLIMGTILAGGSPMAGLRVEALDGGNPIASVSTASDGSYLLTGITVSVTLRISDPGGDFMTELSPLQNPPATYDADLEPNAAVPGLAGIASAILLVELCVLGFRRLRQTNS